MTDGGWPLEKPQRQDAHRTFVSQALVFAPSRLRLKSIQYGGWRGIVTQRELHTPSAGLDTEQRRTSCFNTMLQLNALL